MFKFSIFKHLPPFSNRKLLLKVVLGVFLLLFFLDYQPALSFPPARKNIVRAQTSEQSQIIKEGRLPLIFQPPHSGYISNHFSFFHPGVDVATSLGSNVHPVANGIVTDISFNFWGLGQTVSIDHGFGFQSLYAHLGKVMVKVNQAVTPSDIIAEVGLSGHTSGPHTHLQISKDGKNINPETVLPKIRDYPKEEDLSFVASPSANLR